MKKALKRTFSGLSTGGPEVFAGSGYLFARRLPIDADAALGMVAFSPSDLSAATVTVSAAVANIGLMPWSGAGVRVAFTLVAAGGAETAIGSVAAPAVLQSGELVNVSVSWAIAAGVSGVVRVALQGNHDTNATNDVLSALPARIAFDVSSIGLSSPGDRVMLVADVNSTGPGAANVMVEVRI